MNQKIKITLGAGLFLAGAGLFLSGLPDLMGKKPFSYTLQAELNLGDLPKLETHYPLDKLSTYAIERENVSPLTLQVADYHVPSGQARRAMINLPSEMPSPQKLRHDVWESAAKSIKSHAGPHALFLTWWDDAQRLDLLTGAETWTLLPDASAWTDNQESRFWQEIAGGKEDKLKQLARWLTMDADQAIQEMREQIPKDKDIYWLVSLDDLARLKEIETLAGIQLPFETRLFQTGENFHSLIAEVKRWAQTDKKESNYMVQPVPNFGVRAWKITAPQANDTLIARLLPFTNSLNRLPEGLELVYQSEQAYLSVYRLKRI